MKYTDLNQEEFKLNITDVITDIIIIDLARENSIFVCSDCITTMKQLTSILKLLDSDAAVAVIDEVNEIVEIDDRLPSSYAEIGYSDFDNAEARDGARFDDMNYQYYMER